MRIEFGIGDGEMEDMQETGVGSSSKVLFSFAPKDMTIITDHESSSLIIRVTMLQFSKLG